MLGSVNIFPANIHKKQNRERSSLAHTAQPNPGGLCKALLRRTWGHPFCLPGCVPGRGDRDTPVYSEGHKAHSPGRGSRTGKRVPGLGLNSNDKIKGNLSCMTYPSFPVLLPSPLTRWGDGGRGGLEAQLCYESILMDLVYWLRLNHFPQGLLMGSLQGSMGHLLSLLREQPTLPYLHPWPWGLP